MADRTDYQKQGMDFLAKTGTTFKAIKLGCFPYFEDDKEPRDVYEITLIRGDKKYTFKFGQSIAKSKPYVERRNQEELDRSGRLILHPKNKLYAEVPTPYDVLACVTKYDPGTFKNFCDEFGYDTDSRRAEKLYFAVQEEWSNINRLFGDVMEQLREIQ